MSLQKLNVRTLVLILMIIAATAFRLLSYKFQFLSDATPVGAIALFGGTYFNEKWKAYFVVLITFVISDILINQLYGLPLISSYTLWYCLCFGLVVFMGTLIKKINIANMLVIICLPVLLHWLVMDLPWVTNYPKTVAGYLASLTAAIPFEKNMLYGDIIFGIILFGGFEMAKNRYTILRSNKELAV